eukprot:4843470-Prorocentrum_lima.AAC.1
MALCHDGGNLEVGVAQWATRLLQPGLLIKKVEGPMVISLGTAQSNVALTWPLKQMPSPGGGVVYLPDVEATLEQLL